MKEDRLRELLAAVAEGRVSQDEALERLRTLPFEDLEFAKVDHHRALRCGLPEVIYGEGKTVPQIARIARTIAARGHKALVTRLDTRRAEELKEVLPELEYRETARIAILGGEAGGEVPGRGTVAVVAAGTADVPVAEEAAVTVEAAGQEVVRLYDVGVAGLHRLLAHQQVLRSAMVLIVVAGMEGALPSVVAGLVDRPVIAVPTSVGYGASFGGLAALLAMLNSCAAGVMVVNIDNGFGAGAAAVLINRDTTRG